ncbi:hypothetical protein PAMP_018787 [Pampus punctatissimus]
MARFSMVADKDEYKALALWGNLKLYEAVQGSFVWLCVALHRGLVVLNGSSTFSVRASSSCSQQVHITQKDRAN